MAFTYVKTHILQLWALSRQLMMSRGCPGHDLPMWPMCSFVRIWQGHQIFWSPHSEVNPRSFRQHSREFEFGGVYPLIGGLSGRDNINFVSWSLKRSKSLVTFKWKGIAFHNLGPWTANELSNKDWLAAELALRLDGMIARFSNLGRTTNWISKSLLVLWCKIFHMCRIMNRSRLRWRDIRDKWTKRSQPVFEQITRIQLQKLQSTSLHQCTRNTQAWASRTPL